MLMALTHVPPELVINMDETMLAPVQGRIKVYSLSGKSVPVLQEESKGEHITGLISDIIRRLSDAFGHFTSEKPSSTLYRGRKDVCNYWSKQWVDDL